MTLIKKIKDKKVNFEFNKEYIKVVTDKIANNDALFITNSFKEMHPADAADIIEHLNPNDRESLIKLNNFKIDPEVFVELNESVQSEIIKFLSSSAIVGILKNLESDDAIAILENVDEKDKNLFSYAKTVEEATIKMNEAYLGNSKWAQLVCLNTLTVIFSLVFWGYLWGIPGMILSVPLMVIIKLIFEQFPSLEIVSRILGKTIKI